MPVSLCNFSRMLELSTRVPSCRLINGHVWTKQMTSWESIALRRRDKVNHFDACKLAYRSPNDKAGFYSGVSKVTDTGKNLGIEEDAEKNMSAEKSEDGDTVMQDVGKGDVQEEALEVEEKRTVEKEAQVKAMQIEEKKGGGVPNLHKGNYVMDPTSLSCVIYNVDSIDPEMFRLLESIRHPSVVRHHTFYEENLAPRLVLSGVDSLFSDLLSTAKASERFFTQEIGCVSLKTELVTMIIDLCSGLEHFFKLELYPPKISLDDLYLCKDGPKRYRLQLLILEVEKLPTVRAKITRMVELGTQVKEIVKKIRETTCTDKLSDVDERFVNYISHDVSALAQYPRSWTYEQKGRYLISIISANESVIRDKLKKSGLQCDNSPEKLKKNVLQWAIDDKTGKSPKLIDILINHDKKRSRPCIYNTADPYDYLKLCRSTYKHHDEISRKVPEFKDTCPLRENFLMKMEKWQPMIWCILYDAIGLIASLPTSVEKNGSS